MRSRVPAVALLALGRRQAPALLVIGAYGHPAVAPTAARQHDEHTAARKRRAGAGAALKA
nr:hypothetical protein [uncultured Caldimonas sp.]